MVQPFGVIYNPISIHKALLYGVLGQYPPDHTYLSNQDIFLNYDFHSINSGLSEDEARRKIEGQIDKVRAQLSSTEWLIITYGTAWVYERLDTNEVVANCHKIPADRFEKRLLTTTEVIDSFNRLRELLLKFNSAVKVILTVSPVRHIKDTLELNSVSKSVLRLACHALSEQLDNVEYFPAYEIMMDDLRDYRFYKSDMIHPTADAEDYIFEKFGERYFDQDTKKFVIEWSKILSAIHHRPFHETSSAHQRFLQDTIKRLEAFKNTADVQAEIDHIKSRLT
jgi:hypothetical protein